MKQQRLVLKHPTGWFAAGREMAQAMGLVSDLSFKVYVYVCLNADRHTGRLTLDPAALARCLKKDERVVRAGLEELNCLGVCNVDADAIEIADRYWPYERILGVSAPEDQADFVRQAGAELRIPLCVQSTFLPAEEDLAVGLYKRGVSIEVVKRAIWLGCARKYKSMLNGEKWEAITSLRYFIPIVEEVTQTQVPNSYWDHVREKALAMEQQWLTSGRKQQAGGAVQ